MLPAQHYDSSVEQPAKCGTEDFELLCNRTVSIKK
jgi:hypothetical protein